MYINVFILIFIFYIGNTCLIMSWNTRCAVHVFYVLQIMDPPPIYVTCSQCIFLLGLHELYELHDDAVSCVF